MDDIHGSEWRFANPNRPGYRPRKKLVEEVDYLAPLKSGHLQAISFLEERQRLGLHIKNFCLQSHRAGSPAVQPYTSDASKTKGDSDGSHDSQSGEQHDSYDKPFSSGGVSLACAKRYS